MSPQSILPATAVAAYKKMCPSYKVIRVTSHCSCLSLLIVILSGGEKESFRSILCMFAFYNRQICYILAYIEIDI